LTLSLPQGEAEFRFSDGGNCFNLNSLASDDGDQRDRARTQFAALIQLNGVTASAAGRIVAQAADWVDGDQLITPGGGEDHAYGDGARTPDGPMADPSELLALPAMTSANWRLMAPWLCALPHRDASTFNINTLRPGQALLLGLMTPGLPLERARTLLAARPSGGFASTNLFATELSANTTPLAPSLLRQLSLTSRWFRLHSVVHLGGIDLAMDSLVDVADGDPRIVQRRRETM
jgi:general secretion pathway protein K